MIYLILKLKLKKNGFKYKHLQVVKVIKTQYNEIHNIALWCKGSTQEFDSCNTGSIPIRAVMGM